MLQKTRESTANRLVMLGMIFIVCGRYIAAALRVNGKEMGETVSQRSADMLTSERENLSNRTSRGSIVADGRCLEVEEHPMSWGIGVNLIRCERSAARRPLRCPKVDVEACAFISRV